MEPKAADADCEHCPLKDQPVAYSSGPEDAKIAIVGEAPGLNEARQGQAFVGVSGKLLDMIMEHHGISRPDVLVTNACLCRPANNKTPPKEAVNACWPRLRRELSTAETIVALGNTAAQKILDTRTGITSLRTGPPRSSPFFPGARVIPTIHPAAALRSPDHFPSIVTDIGKVNTNYDAFEEPRWVALEDPTQTQKALAELLKSDYETIAIDIEVGVEKDQDFSHPDSLLCVGLCFDKNRVVVIGEQALQDKRVLHSLRRLLEAKYVLAHNGKYDIQVLMRLGILDHPHLQYDTMLMSYCMDERPGYHSLQGLATEHLGAPSWKHAVDPYVGDGGSYALIPRDILYKYNAWDVACTYSLWQFFSSHPEWQFDALHQMLVAAAQATIVIELEGLKVDIDYMNELSQDYVTVLEGLELGLSEWVVNPRSPKQVKEAFEELGVILTSTDKDALTEIAEERVRRADHRAIAFAREMLKYRREHKLYSTYVKGIRKRTTGGRVYPTFLLHGTVSGRLSCRNPNLQNIPRESSIRRMFVPTEGKVFVQCDYGQAELRVIAHLANDQYLKEVFADGRDLHSEVAREFYGDDFTKDQRVRAKAVVFGLAYGREPESIAAEYNMPVSEARQFVQTFFHRIPDTVAWRESIKDTVLRRSEPLISPYGRHRRFHLITRDNQMDVIKEAYSFLPQSTASDLCLNAAAALVTSWRQEGMWGPVQIKVLVHDSILVECPPETLDDVISDMQTAMMYSALDLTEDIPFPTDVEIGDSWGTLKPASS